MALWLTLAVNSIALGGLLFLLSAGFSLIFGLMRIPNLMHGSFFMLGAYLGATILDKGLALGGTFHPYLHLFGATLFDFTFRLPDIVLIAPHPNFVVATLISGATVAALGT